MTKLMVGVDLVCLEVVPHCFVVAFQVLVDGGSVVVEVWVGFLLQALSLRVGLEGVSELVRSCLHHEEVSQVGVAQHV